MTDDRGKGDYRPGRIIFQAREGKSIDVDKIRESLKATRLSGNTGMGVTSLLLTVKGQVVVSDKEVLLKVKGTAQQFVLGEYSGAKATDGKKVAFQRFRESLGKREGQLVTVTGYVNGWTGRFPDVLKARTADAEAGKLPLLQVTEFELVKE
jgi:hypothetical protein